MSTIKTIETAGTPIHIEVDEPSQGLEKTGALTNAINQFGAKTLQNAVDVLVSVTNMLNEAKTKYGDVMPDSVELSFGIKITATGDVWIAKASGESQLTAKINWKK